MSDNYRFLLASQGREHFNSIMKLAFGQCKKATHYSVSEKYGLTLFWTAEETATALPFDMAVEAATDFAWHWLCSAPIGPEPDHDGDNERGFEVGNEAWGHVDNKWRAFVYIKPIWMMYGK